MSIVVTCGACGKKLKAPDSYEGKKGKCPTCRAEIFVTRNPEDVATTPTDEPAPGSAPAAAPGAQAAPKAADDSAEDVKLKLLQVEGFGDIAIVRFATSRVLDGSNVDQLGKEFEFLIKQKYMIKMVVNFEKVKYMSSAVLGKLITLHKMIIAEKGKLKFCGIDSTVMEIFKIMKLDKLFKIFESEEKAVESFGKWFG